MQRFHQLAIILLLLTFTIQSFSQYQPEIDARSMSDDTDGSELQLATPSESHFLRFFSGRNGDANPFIYFSDADLMHFATGKNDFTGFKSLMILDPEGSILVPGLQGSGIRNLVVNSDGVLTEDPGTTEYLSISGPAFTPEDDDQVLRYVAGPGGAQFIDAPANQKSMIAPVMIPHGSVLDSVKVYYTDLDGTNDVDFVLGAYDNASGSSATFLTISSSMTGINLKAEGGVTHTINNRRNAYWIQMKPKVAGTMNTSFAIHQVIIQYSR